VHALSMLLFGAFYFALAYLCSIGLTWLATRNEPSMWGVRDTALKPVVVLLGLFGITVKAQASRPEVREEMGRDNALESGRRGGGANQFRSEQEAKEYLINRIVVQAKREGAPLDEIERKMLYFSETGWTLPDIMEINAAFERDYRDVDYEEKISRLIHNLAERATAEEHETWDQAVLKLSEGDHYLLVMVDAARPSPVSQVPKGLSAWIPKLDSSGKPESGDRLRLIGLSIAILTAILAIELLFVRR